MTETDNAAVEAARQAGREIARNAPPLTPAQLDRIDAAFNGEHTEALDRTA